MASLACNRASCAHSGALTSRKSVTAAPQPLKARIRRQLHCRASIVSRSTLPDEFKESNGYKLQFVVFSRLAPEKTTAVLKEHLADHEAWLQGLGDQLAFHGPFLNAEV